MSVIFSSPLVISPCRPNRKMMDRHRMKGGDRMGRVAMVFRKPLQGTGDGIGEDVADEGGDHCHDHSQHHGAAERL